VPSDPELGLAAFRIAVQRADDAGAITRLETLHTRFPTHPEVGFLFAEHLFREGQVARARDIWAEVRAVSHIWGPEANARLRATEPRVAPAPVSAVDFSLEAAQWFLNQHPDQPEAYLRVAFAAWAESPDSRVADDALEDATLIFGDHPVVRLGDIWRHLVRGNLTDAADLLARSSTPDDYATAFSFARASLNHLADTPSPSDDLREGLVLAPRGLAPPLHAPISLRLHAP